jgi:hypothetical protein
MPSALKFSDIVGIGITNEKDIEIIGKTDGRYIKFELPGKASAILSALFSAYACELGIGGKEEKEHANLFLSGFELRPPMDGTTVPLLLKFKPDLSLWLTIPIEALEDMGRAFLGAAEAIAAQANETNKS